MTSATSAFQQLPAQPLSRTHYMHNKLQTSQVRWPINRTQKRPKQYAPAIKIQQHEPGRPTKQNHSSAVFPLQKYFFTQQTVNIYLSSCGSSKNNEIKPIAKLHQPASFVSQGLPVYQAKTSTKSSKSITARSIPNGQIKPSLNALTVKIIQSSNPQAKKCAITFLSPPLRKNKPTRIQNSPKKPNTVPR